MELPHLLTENVFFSDNMKFLEPWMHQYVSFVLPEGMERHLKHPDIQLKKFVFDFVCFPRRFCPLKSIEKNWFFKIFFAILKNQKIRKILWILKLPTSKFFWNELILETYPKKNLKLIISFFRENSIFSEFFFSHFGLHHFFFDFFSIFFFEKNALKFFEVTNFKTIFSKKNFNTFVVHLQKILAIPQIITLIFKKEIRQ